jgi:hypothetical protein
MEYVRLEVDWNWDLLKAKKQLQEFLDNQEDLKAFIMRQEKDEEKNVWFECFLMFENDLDWQNFMVDFWNASIQTTCKFETSDFESMYPKEEAWFKEEIKKKLSSKA